MALYTTRQSLESLSSQSQTFWSPSEESPGDSESNTTDSRSIEYPPKRPLQPEQKFGLVGSVIVSQPQTSGDRYTYDLPRLALKPPDVPLPFVPSIATLVPTNKPDQTKDLLTCALLENHPRRTWYDPVDRCLRPPISAAPFDGLFCRIHEEEHPFLESRYGYKELETEPFFDSGSMTEEPDTCLSREPKSLYTYQCAQDPQTQGTRGTGIEGQGGDWTRVLYSNIGKAWCKTHHRTESIYESIFRRKEGPDTEHDSTHDQPALDTNDAQSISFWITVP